MFGAATIMSSSNCSLGSVDCASCCGGELTFHNAVLMDMSVSPVSVEEAKILDASAALSAEGGTARSFYG
jgi:hypothetical protein